MSDDPTTPQSSSSLSSSAMALSLSELQQRLPAGVTLEKAFGETILRARVDGAKPALAFLAGGVGGALYFGLAELTWVSLPLLAIGAVIAAGYALGRRRITVADGKVSLRTFPIPLPGDGSLRGPFSRVDVVIVGAQTGSVSYRIDVVESQARARRQPLVQDITDAEQAMVLARYLATELRVRLPTAPISLT